MRSALLSMVLDVIGYSAESGQLPQLVVPRPIPSLAAPPAASIEDGTALIDAVFHEMVVRHQYTPTSNDWTSLIEAYIRIGRHDAATAVMRALLAHSMNEDVSPKPALTTRPVNASAIISPFPSPAPASASSAPAPAPPPPSPAAAAAATASAPAPTPARTPVPTRARASASASLLAKAPVHEALKTLLTRSSPQFAAAVQATEAAPVQATTTAAAAAAAPVAGPVGHRGNRPLVIPQQQQQQDAAAAAAADREFRLPYPLTVLSRSQLPVLTMRMLLTWMSRVPIAWQNRARSPEIRALLPSNVLKPLPNDNPRPKKWANLDIVSQSIALITKLPSIARTEQSGAMTTEADAKAEAQIEEIEQTLNSLASAGGRR